MNSTPRRALLLLLVTLVLASGCSSPGSEDFSSYQRYDFTFFDTFDTVIQVIAYTESEEDFNAFMAQIQERYQELHRIYDIYNTYPGMNNVKTVNDQAGIAPVAVDQELIDLVLLSREWYDRTEGRTNIALGPVTRIWHEYRTEAEFDPRLAAIPPLEDLQAADQFTDIHMVEVDEAAGTIYLPDYRMRLDVGAIAKGYATELVAREMKAAGLNSMIISAGGNVRALDRPKDASRETWNVGLQNPEAMMFSNESALLGTVTVTNMSVVSSGDYQRFYIVDGQPVHHIIDPTTLMPGDYYRAITVLMEDSGLADFFSTELFLLPLEESMAMAESYEGLEAIWVLPDGSVEMTPGLEPERSFCPESTLAKVL